MTTKPYTLDRIVRLMLTAGLCAALVWLVHYVAAVLVPLVVGILLAYLLSPLVGWVEGWMKNRTAAVLSTVVVLLVVLLGLLAVLVPVVSHEFKTGVQLVRSAVQPDSSMRQRLERRLPPDLAETVQETLRDERLQHFLAKNTELRAFAVATLKRVVPQLWGLLSGALAFVGAALQVCLVLVYLVFILIDFRRFEQSWPEYLPPAHRHSIVSFLHAFNDGLSRYFRGQFVIAAIMGVLFAIGFSIVGLRMAVFLGLFIGVLNMVPYLQTVGIFPAVMLAGMTAIEKDGSFAAYLIGVALVFIVAQVLQDVLITPRVMGRTTGLRPVIILFCILFWGKLLGFLGVLLAIPLTCLGLAYYRRLLEAQTSAGA